ncbi:MAG: HAMP domain-containing protein [Acidobacteria bacterium]|nr:HAMP domain-containing protein [Acidobacteriota bacterium]
MPRSFSGQGGIPPLPAEARSPQQGKPAAGGRRFPILYTLLLVLLVTGLVPLSIAAWKQIAISRESLITSTQENQLMVAASIARSLSSSLEEARVQLMKLSDMFEAVIREGGQGILEKMLRDRGTMAGYLASDMVLVRYLPATGGRFDALREGSSLSGSLERILAQGAELARRGEATLSDPIALGPQGAYAVAFSTPVGGTEGKPVHGVLQSLIDLAPLWERAVGTRLLGYTVFALDGNGSLFASLDEEGMLDRTDFKNFDIVRKFLAAPTKSKETSGFTVTLDGVNRDFLASVDATNQGWGIFVQVEKRLAYSSVQAMIYSTITWAMVALALALALGVWLAGSIARPVNQLAETARAFARGDFAARADIRSHSELGELAQTYNRMSDQIQDHIKRLHAAALENQELFLGTIKALASAIDEKDPYTHTPAGHNSQLVDTPCGRV